MAKRDTSYSAYLADTNPDMLMDDHGNYHEEEDLEAPTQYQARDFRSQKGNMNDRRYGRYVNSRRGQAEKNAFDLGETRRVLESSQEVNNYNAWVAQQQLADAQDAARPAKKAAPAGPAPAPAPALVSRNSYWDTVAQQNGFENSEAVRAWQQQNGLVADGKFGQRSKAKWDELNRRGGARPGTTYRPGAPGAAGQKSVARDIADDMPIVGSLVTGRDFFNNPTKASAKAFGKRLLWDAVGAAVPAVGIARIGKGLYDGATRWWNGLSAYRNGGNLRRYQQGGAAPQGDPQQEIIAMVQAAMSGDEQAMQAIQQIKAAAEQGDPQSQQLFQMIEQIIQELQGQAPAARYGAKLNYLRSLKPARTNWLR